jgi:hypothetical protein
MKTLKLMDFWLQIILIVVCLLLVILGSLDPLSGYFIVGGFQLIGMLIHEITKSFIPKNSARRVYQNIVYVIVGFMLLAPLLNVFGIIFIRMTYAAPLMAVYYVRICYKETYNYFKRPLSVLK